MTSALDNLRLEVIADLASRATPAPWAAISEKGEAWIEKPDGGRFYFGRYTDAMFVSVARMMLPQLIERIQYLEEQLENCDGKETK